MLFGKKSRKIVTDIVKTPLMLIHNSGEIHDVNEAFCALLPIKKEVLIGRNYHEIGYLKPIEKNISSVIRSKKMEYQRYSFGDKYFEASVYPFSVDYAHYTFVCLYEITPFLEIEKELLKRNRELMIINTLSGAFISSENIEEVFSELLEKVLLITDFTTGWIMFNNEGKFEIRSAHGISKLFYRDIFEGKISDLCNNIAAINDPLYIYEDDELNDLPFIKKEGLVILAAVPIKTGKKLRGIMFLASRVERAFDFNLASILSLIGSQLTLIVEKIELFEETRRLSITDSLTGLYNSRHFYQALDKEIAMATRYKQIFSLAIFDIDDFKVLNDTYGHQAGDDVLKNIASILKKESRETDIVARYGGEEFVIIFPNTPKKDALAVSERILSGVNEHTFLPEVDKGIKTTISGGISSFPDDGSIVRDILYNADMALYKAKSSGKRQVVCYNVSYEKGIQKT
jgi:diguanylate cyclase (GGDEF)-like protein